jgi:hypothetical protein
MSEMILWPWDGWGETAPPEVEPGKDHPRDGGGPHRSCVDRPGGVRPDGPDNGSHRVAAPSASGRDQTLALGISSRTAVMSWSDPKESDKFITCAWECRVLPPVPGNA